MKKIPVGTLIIMIYFMVAGGPYGLEDIVHDAGYAGAIAILLITPLLWSLPTALMVSELASAIPEEGGFYVWVRRGLGRFWGFEEAWLTLVGSIFDMAIYPTLFAAYLGHFFPQLAGGWSATLTGVLMIAICTGWNLLGSRAIGLGTVALSVLLLGPFAILIVYAVLRQMPQLAPAAIGHPDILAGILFAMWNYMGWDNASTIAGEVENPQRTYPLAMFGAVTLVAITYVLPIGAVALTGIPSDSWTSGGWAAVAKSVFDQSTGVPGGWIEIARQLAGTGLALAITFGGVVGAVGTFNSLTMSLSRIPVALAHDNLMPKCFAKRSAKTGAPYVAIIVCATCWTLCLGLTLTKLVVLDVLLTGLSIMLEFAALTALRVKEPNLTRYYRVPGGIVGTILIGLPPLALMIITILRNKTEALGPINALCFGAILIAIGCLIYSLNLALQKKFSE